MADVHGNVIPEALARVDAHERRPVKTAMRNNCFVMYFLYKMLRLIGVNFHVIRPEIG